MADTLKDSSDRSALLALLASWLPRQRWYPRKGGLAGDSQLALEGELDLPSADPTVRFRVLFVRVGPEESSQLLQVPLSFHTTEQPKSASVPERIPVGFVGRLAGLSVYDGLGDRAFLQAWLDLLDNSFQDEGSSASAIVAARLHSWVHPQWSDVSRVGLGAVSKVRVVGTEQSNSSVIFELGGRPVIVKIFRVLHSGNHPEQEIGVALSGLADKKAVTQVPALRLAVKTRRENTTLFVVHDFVPAARDAWVVALEAATAGKDFTEQAHAIGETLAQVHLGLAQSLGEHRQDSAGVADFIGTLSARLQVSWDLVGTAIGPYGEQLQGVLARLNQIKRLPPLQRIHGDLHLGQILHQDTAAPGDGWHILDFEGEPLRPLAERSRVDVVLRDIAGMLRSFDYAGAQAADTGTTSRAVAAAWAASSSAAFIAGYDSGSDTKIDKDSALFMALWLDKALYEVAYELQNRPDWVWVPVNAVRELFETRESGVDVGLNKLAPMAVDAEVLARISEGTYYAPHSVLGAHLGGEGFATIRTLRHLATGVQVVTDSGEYPMTHEHGGIWVAVVPVENSGKVPDYRLDVGYADGVLRCDDPYRYLPTVGELDMHLIAEGRHETLWTVLGAHVQRYHSQLGEVSGVSFSVWVPGVQAVRVIGGFNSWDGRAHAMRSLGGSGIWELFIPDIAAGECYKFEILSENGQWLQKADPMAYGTEVPPLTASCVVESTYAFQDGDWMAQRAKSDPHNAPMSVYEVHLGSWRPGLSYVELAKELVEYVQWLGFTHVELMPVSEHPFGGSWGYQVTSYYAPTSRFGHPDQFRHLVDALHQAGIGVIMDWVPAHFPKDEWALAKFNGVAQYEHANPQLGEHPDWGTLIFDFGRNEVRNFLVANALYWFEEFHIDGLRVDAVASMLYLDYSRDDGAWSPNRFGGRENLEAISFLQEMNATAYRRNPGIVTIAEESTAFPGVTAPTSGGGLGFGIKWNMGWMHDSLTYMAEDPINRGWHHNQITFSLVYAFTENFMLPISHDEVVHGKGSLLRKMPGDRWQQLANLRAYLAFQWAHPGKQLIFMGTEFGQEAEWSEQHGLDWWLAENPAHSGIQELVRDLNQSYAGTPALYELDNVSEGFTWLNGGDTENNVLSFVRWDKSGNPLVCIINFSGVAYEGYRVGLPQLGGWEEALNTDLSVYGGSDVRNIGELTAEDLAWDGQEASLRLRVPPLGALYLVPKGPSAR